MDHPTQQQPGGYSPPQPTVYDYSQWQPGTQHSTGGTVEEEQHGQQESSTRKEGVEFIGSGDSHVTEKKAGEENESREKDENKKGMIHYMCTDVISCDFVLSIHIYMVHGTYCRWWQEW